MSPEGIEAAKRRIKTRMADSATAFSITVSDVGGQFARNGVFQSSQHVLTLLRACDDELLKRSAIAWQVICSVLDSEGYVASEDNRGQIRAIVEASLTSDSRDLDETVRRAHALMPGNWRGLTEGRAHALESTMAEAEIDLLGRRARRGPLAEELSAPRYAIVREHWKNALDEEGKEKPNLANAVKEASHAVESMAQIVAGKSGLTLGEAVKQLRSQQRIPVGSDKVIEGLYAFASASPGARHGSTEPPRVEDIHWGFARTTAEGGIRLLLDIDGDTK
jgi:hypothetical protein